MNSHLIASLLKTLGLDPQLLANTAGSIVTLAQSIDRRMAAIEAAVKIAERRLCLIEVRLARLCEERGDTEPAHAVRRPDKRGHGLPPLLAYIDDTKHNASDSKQEVDNARSCER